MLGITKSKEPPSCPVLQQHIGVSGRDCVWAAIIGGLMIVGSTGAFAQEPDDLISTPQEATDATVSESLQAVEDAATAAAAELSASIAGKVTIGLEFETSRLFTDSNSLPPDTMGAVGPNHIVEMINGNFEIFDKFTGASLETRSLDSFWTNRVGLPQINGGRFDPRVVFDPDSERWFAVSIDRDIDADNDGVPEVSNNIYVGRSDTDDPNGDWDGVSFDADTVGNEEFHDYPTLGLDADGVYICTQDFGDGGNESCYSIPKADLLLAAPSIANMTRFEDTGGLPVVSGSIQAAVDFGLSDGRSALLGVSGGSLVRSNIFGAAGAGAFLDTPVAITGDPGHTGPPAARQPHPIDPSVTIENVAPRFVGNVFELGDRLWAVHAVQGSGSNSALRWYEIDETTDTVIQTGLIDDPDRDFHEPSIAVNEFGNVVIGFTCSGPTLAASTCVSVGETSGGVTTFEAPAILFTGLGHYYRDGVNRTGRNRWGDYSATVIDPVDSCTFWTFQEYVAVSAVGDVGPSPRPVGGTWGTRIAELTFDSCAGGDLKVVKDCKPDQPLLAGETGICTIVVENLGPGPALEVEVVDNHISNGTFTFGTVTTTAGVCTATPNPQVLTGDVTCELGRLSQGDTVTIQVPVSATEPQDINDHVTVSSLTLDPNLENNQAEDGVSVIAQADLAIDKSDSPDPVTAGETLTYSLTVTNNGPSTAVNVLISDIVPAGVSIDSVSATGGGTCNAGVPGDSARPTTCAFNSMADGTSQTMTIVVTVLPETTGILHNDASVSSDVADTNNANNLATESTLVNTEADLVVAKSDSPDPVLAGDQLTYIITVTNDGPSLATDVSLTDTLPTEVDFDSVVANNGGTCVEVQPGVVDCTLGDLAVGQTVTVFIDVMVDPSVPNGTTISNNVTATSPISDPNGANNSEAENTLVNAEADLWMEKTGGLLTTTGSTGNSSGTLRYFLTVHNDAGCTVDANCGAGGPSDAQNIAVVDTLPEDPKKIRVEFISPECTYDGTAHQVTCTTTVLPAGQTVTYEIQAAAKGRLNAIINTATVSSTTTDPVPGNNTHELETVVRGGTGNKGGKN